MRVNTLIEKMPPYQNKDKREEIATMQWHHSASLKDCRILVLEDEYFLADDLERALKIAGRL